MAQNILFCAIGHVLPFPFASHCPNRICLPKWLKGKALPDTFDVRAIHDPFSSTDFVPLSSSADVEPDMTQ